MSTYNSLVSVVVICYNSAQYILETLESIKSQSYKNIELIITDDNSSDSTVEICKKWLNDNSACFVKTYLITSTKNTGVAPNLNRGCKKASGKWIKPIAGDDILLDNCIMDSVNYAENNDLAILFTDFELFGCTDQNVIDQIRSYYDRNKALFGQSAKDQYRYLLLKENFVPAITSFIRKDLLEGVGFYDENTPMMEDFPMWVILTRRGIQLSYLDIKTVRYRIHNNSLTSSSNFQKVVDNYYMNTLFYLILRIKPIKAIKKYFRLKQKYKSK